MRAQTDTWRPVESPALRALRGGPLAFGDLLGCVLAEFYRAPPSGPIQGVYRRRLVETLEDLRLRGFVAFDDGKWHAVPAPPRPARPRPVRPPRTGVTTVEAAIVRLAPDERALLIGLLQEALNALSTGPASGPEADARARHGEELDALLLKIRLTPIRRRTYQRGIRGKGGRPPRPRP
jgi:hypothetical protein